MECSTCGADIEVPREELTTKRVLDHFEEVHWE